MSKFLSLMAIYWVSSLIGITRAGESGEERLAKLIFLHSIRVEEVDAPLRKKIEALNASYVKALERQAEEAQKAGKLEDLLAIRSEVDHVNSNGKPGEKPFSGDAKMRQKYNEAGSAFASQSSAERSELLANHLAELEALKVELTKSGDLKTAIEVDTYLKGLESDKAVPAHVPTPGRSDRISFATNTVKESPLLSGVPFLGNLDLETGIYEIRERVVLGSDEPERREDRYGHVVAFPGTVFNGGEFFINNGSLKATGSLLEGVDLNVDLHGEVFATDCIFDGGKIRKGGAWGVKWFSAKWTMQNCVLHGCFIAPMKVGANGVKLTNCTVIGATLSPGEYVEKPVEESANEWRQIERCHFIHCEIPESILLMTEDCVFENCTFVADIEAVKPERSSTVTMYFTGGIPSPPAGNNRVKFKGENAIALKKSYGSTVKHGF